MHTTPRFAANPFAARENARKHFVYKRHRRLSLVPSFLLSTVQRRNTLKTSRRRIVSFELPPAILEQLQDDAKTRGSSSVHQRARDIVMDYLSNRDTAELSEGVAALDADIAYLGDLVRKVAFSVIVHAAGKDSKLANEWIRNNMARQTNP